jgi:hypothetical protein
LGERFNKDSTIHFLRKAPILVGCGLFFLSMILPFYRFNLVSYIETRASILYWSFKSRIEFFNLLRPHRVDPVVMSEQWFHDHWFDSYASWFGLSYLLIIMFVIQILVLVTVTISVLTRRKVIAFTPVIFCSTVTALMIFTNVILQAETLALNSYELGYWLTYPTLLLFLTNLLLKIRS